MRVNDLSVGQRVRLRRDVRRRLDDGTMIAATGGTLGTVEESTERRLVVLVDLDPVLVPYWDGRLYWYDTNDDLHHPVRDLELVDEGEAAP